MFKIFRIIVLILLLFFLTTNVSATYKVGQKIETVFSSFIKKIEKKYTPKNEIKFLKSLNSKIQNILDKKKLKFKNKKLLKDILILSNEEIFKINNKIKLENPSQIFLEASIVGELRRKIEKIKENKISNSFKNKEGIKVIKISEKNEFVENNKIKRLNYIHYFIVNNRNYKRATSKKGFLLIKENGQLWFVEKGKIEKKIPYSLAHKYTKGFIKYNKKSFLEKNTFYSYNFNGFTYFEDKFGFYLTNLRKSNFNIENYVLYLSENKRYNLIKNYSKTKLISSDIIYGITDKNTFLNDLINDKLYLIEDTDFLFKKLKNEIYITIKDRSREEKIKIIYNFILKNISYPEQLDLNDKKIFSGILSYKNKSGVCEGYVKLMSYALKFAGIPEASVIRGDVIDAQDFPNIGHAWLKIGKLYYDPTFDDPIGQNKTKTFLEYKYFAIPRDLLYANRFDYGVTPNVLKTKSLDFRKKFVNQRLSKLSEKYRGKNYLVLKGVDFAKKNNLVVGDKINIEIIKKLVPFYSVIETKKGIFYFYKEGQKKEIVKLQYYTVTDANIEQVIAQLNFKLDGLYLFNWEKVNGKKEWRIGFNVKIR